jgi:hypothetical protein
VVEAVAAGGNVLLPCDAAGRVLELALILDQARGTMAGATYLLCIHRALTPTRSLHCGPSLCCFSLCICVRVGVTGTRYGR